MFTKQDKFTKIQPAISTTDFDNRVSIIFTLIPYTTLDINPRVGILLEKAKNEFSTLDYNLIKYDNDIYYEKTNNRSKQLKIEKFKINCICI